MSRMTLKVCESVSEKDVDLMERGAIYNGVNNRLLSLDIKKVIKLLIKNPPSEVITLDFLCH